MIVMVQLHCQVWKHQMKQTALYQLMPKRYSNISQNIIDIELLVASFVTVLHVSRAARWPCQSM